MDTLSAQDLVRAETIAAYTDTYFNKTKEIVRRFGDKTVTYAIFLRRPVISAPKLMLDWIEEVAAARDTVFDIEVLHAEGEWVGGRRAAALCHR